MGPERLTEAAQYVYFQMRKMERVNLTQNLKDYLIESHLSYRKPVLQEDYLIGTDQMKTLPLGQAEREMLETEQHGC